jgi:ABC-type sugar transport system substrate-binding protein
MIVRTTVCAALAGLALSVAACGDGDDTTKGGGAASAASPSGGGNASGSAADSGAGLPEPVPPAELDKLATTAAEKAGEPVAKPPAKTIGVLQNIGGAESNDRGLASVKEAAAKFGWKIITLDPQGNPAKDQEYFQSLINQKVDAIVTQAVATAAIKQGLQTAAQKKIPVINILGPVEPDPAILGSYVSDRVETTKALWKYMQTQLPKDAKIGLQVFPALLSIRQESDTLKPLLEQGGVEVVDEHQSDLQNLGPDTTRATQALLQGHPDVNALWAGLNVNTPFIAPALRAAGKCGKVQFYTYDALQINLNELRKGCVTAVVATPDQAAGWAAIDQLAEYFARGEDKTKVATDWNTLAEDYGGVNLENADSIFIVDKNDVPPEGQEVTPKYDFRAFYATKWAKEYK